MLRRISAAVLSTAALITWGLTAPAPPAVAATCPPVPERREPDPSRPRYRLSAHVDLDRREVRGEVDVDFTPDLRTDRLVLRLWPNAMRGSRLTTGQVRVDGIAVASRLTTPTLLDVPVSGGIGGGQTVRVTVPYVLRVGSGVSDRVAVHGTSMRLGSFFPVVPWEPGIGWSTNAPTRVHGEAQSSPTADFDLSVTTAPADLTVLASGVKDRPGHWRADAVRDIGMSVGRFRVERGTANAPQPVAVVVGVAAGLGDDPRAYLAKVVRVLEDHGRRFGAYPWPTYTLALTPGFKGGVEYPGYVLQGPGSIGRSTTHEIGHMWFYGLVGNDQGRDPWLDEGLATWSEARFDGTTRSFLAKRIPVDARGRTSRPTTFWDGRRSSYYRGVYVQGLKALAALGPAGDVDCALRLYVATNAHRIARPSDLIAAMERVFPDARRTLARYGIR